jgi:uncharacterized protein (DUF342 family)
MLDDIIYESKYITISKKDKNFYIQTYQKGLSMQEFNVIISKHNNIRIVDFNVIKDAILKAPQESKKFGDEKKRITIDVTKDEMKAYLTLCVEDKEFVDDRTKIISEIKEALSSKGITFGLKLDDIIAKNLLVLNKKILIAEGNPVVNGTDSTSFTKELNTLHPEETFAGNVNHFELNLITRVSAGDWLAEWTNPTPGENGTTVTSKEVKAIAGKKSPLKYDKKTVQEQTLDTVTQLVALQDGAFQNTDGKISVSDILEIKGDVDYNTGNIKFDGSVIVTGTVKDSFSITAAGNIEILGKDGVGCAKNIVSTNGNVLIYGGVTGKGTTFIKAKKDIHLKFASYVDIQCNGTLNVNSYLINSEVSANELIIEGSNGQLIGGTTKLVTKLVCPRIGAVSEQKTIINLEGISKSRIRDELVDNLKDIDKLKTQFSKLEQELKILQSKDAPTKEENFKIQKLLTKSTKIKDEIKEIDDYNKRIAENLKVRGEAEVTANKMIYPKVVINMDGITKFITEPLKSITLYLDEGEIKDN